MEIKFNNIQEIHSIIGPYIRNKIQAKTKKFKKDVNHTCQNPNCTEKNYKHLEAAHKHGFERKDMIEKLLNEYKTTEGFYIKDINQFTQTIINQTEPEVLLFLCRKCHIAYDKNLIEINL